MKQEAISKQLLSRGWTYRKISEICSINPGKPNGLSFENSRLTSFVPMSAINGEQGIIAAMETVPYSKVKKGYTYFQEGDILFAKITPCMQNRKSAIALGLLGGIGFGSTEFHVVRVNRDIALPKWVFYFLRTSRFIDNAQRNFTGAVGQQRVPSDFLKNYQIPVASLPEQRKIVERLDQQMALVAHLKARVDEQLTLMKAGLHSFLDRIFYDLNGYSEITIGEVFSTRYGLSTPSCQDKSKTFALGMKNITYDGDMVVDEISYINLTAEEISKHKLLKGDLLFNRTNSAELVGKTTVFNIDGEYVALSYLVVATPDQKRIDSEYVAAYLNSSKMKRFIFENCNKAISQANFSATKLSQIKVPFPPLAMQKTIVNKINLFKYEISKLKENLFLQSDAIYSLKEAILNKEFKILEQPEA